MFADFDCRQDQNFQISKIHLLILDQYVSWWGLSDIFGGLSRLALAWRHYDFMLAFVADALLASVLILTHSVYLLQNLLPCGAVNNNNTG